MRRRNAARLHLLSVREVQTAKDGDHSDGGGLYIRIRGDSANFLFRYTAPTGKRREMGLGVLHRGNAAQAGQSLVNARELAAGARLLVQKGQDPIDERDRSRESARQAAEQEKEQRQRTQLTLARVARDYHERVIEPSRSKRHGAEWIGSLERKMPAKLWNAPIATITAPDLLDFLIELRAEVPETAVRVRQRLETVFDDAVFRGLCGTNPAAATRRKMREVQVRNEVQPLRALPFDQAPAFLARVREAQGTAARCLEFAVLTASRTAEAIGAEWSEFDLESGIWTVPSAKMKAGEAHQVSLTPRTIEILEVQKGLHPRYVFPSPMASKSDQHLSNIAMLQLLSRLGMRDKTTVHGLCRATFSTWANETAAARPDVIEACLAHRESDLVRKAYNRAKFTAERRALLEAWADFLARPVGANVVEFPARAAA